jgi:hypothetical protein
MAVGSEQTGAAPPDVSGVQELAPGYRPAQSAHQPDATAAAQSSSEPDLPLERPRAALIEVAGSAMASMGVKEPSKHLLEPLARIIIDLVK